MFDRTLIPHPFDPRTQVDIRQALWHACPQLEAFVRDAIEKIRPDCWVETGTMLGWTCAWLAENFPWLPIYTCEIDGDFFRRSGENLARYSNITRTHEHSATALWTWLPELKEKRVMAFLDAHWGIPPLKEEARIMALLPRAVILVDDFQCWDPQHGGDTHFSMGPPHGVPHHNDLSFVYSELGDAGHYRPAFPTHSGHNGVGVWVRGIDYVPPATWRRETYDQFLTSRPAEAYPLHPSSVRAPVRRSDGFFSFEGFDS
jgi:hypothetical protein